MGRITKTKPILQQILLTIFSLGISIVVALSSHRGTEVMALPPVDDIPEEILRTEIITAARSPIDGKPLTAAEYAELQEQLQTSPPPKLNSNLRQTVYLIQLRKTLLQLFPFLNF